MRIPLEFKECDACASKPGSPILCDGCLNNREVISRLRATHKNLKKAEKIPKKCTCTERGIPDFYCRIHGR